MSRSVASGNPGQHALVRHRHGRLWTVVGLLLLGAVVFYVVILYLNWPFGKQIIVDTLQERSRRPVTIQRFHETFFPPGCVAEGVTFRHIKDKSRPPLIVINKLVIQTSYASLLSLQRRLSQITVTGMHVIVPAVEPSGEPSPMMPLTYSNSTKSMTIGTILADKVVLDFLSQEPGKKPLHIVVNKLALRNVGNNRPMSYQAYIYNFKLLPGKIESTGSLGPWNPQDPGKTPAHGKFSYREANLAALNGFSGTLSSRGKFAGTLGKLNVSGTAVVPNFHLIDSGHTRSLSTDFQVTVDATQGNVFLDRVLASFDNTQVLFKGAIAGKPGQSGKAVSLAMSSHRARVEDLLDLFITRKLAPMTGDIRFASQVNVPPGPGEFVKKLRLTGSFQISEGKFTNAKTEAELARLSMSAVEGDKKEDERKPKLVLCNLEAQVSAHDGLADLSNMSFRVPGAHASMRGTYSLINYTSNIHGVLITKGNLSDATTGLKSMFAKVIAPFLKRKRRAKVVPFKITGPYGHAAVSLELGSKRKSTH
ncbi:MAG TPA: AsmA-like C-terminal region-containing protein [Bryobacteraceae bacterium]|nr:AsmA-like C-terminal region-containing protein [Bryobacteraceae bacterium]